MRKQNKASAQKGSNCILKTESWPILNHVTDKILFPRTHYLFTCIIEGSIKVPHQLFLRPTLNLVQ